MEMRGRFRLQTSIYIIEYCPLLKMKPLRILKNRGKDYVLIFLTYYFLKSHYSVVGWVGDYGAENS